ncbi:MAG: hypothetical protein Q8Q25_01095, partial [bacterium]|nr:hypothetical protein [bacterium]
MTNIQKSFFLCLTLFCTQTQLILSQNTQQDSSLEDKGRFIDIFDDNDPFLDEFLSTPATQTRQLDPQNIIQFLNNLSAITLLQENFFLRTNPFNKQSLLDMPVLGHEQCIGCDNRIFGFDLFYNQTSRCNFTPDSTKLSSYVALQEGSLIDKIQKIVDQLSPDPLAPAYNIDIQKVFNLFENMTVQERRFGSMLFWIQKWKNSIGHFRIPLYYLERNFYLSNDEQEAVEAEFGALEPEEQKRFQKAHFISDKFGFGDARIELETSVFERPAFQVNTGVQTTLPTAFIIAKSMMGSTFPRPSTFPSIDFDEIFTLAEKGDP